MPQDIKTQAKEGYQGQGHTGFTKYPAESAPVAKNGGNSAEHDGVVSEQSPESMFGGSAGSLGKSKGK